MTDNRKRDPQRSELSLLDILIERNFERARLKVKMIDAERQKGKIDGQTTTESGNVTRQADLSAK